MDLYGVADLVRVEIGTGGITDSATTIPLTDIADVDNATPPFVMHFYKGRDPYTAKAAGEIESNVIVHSVDTGAGTVSVTRGDNAQAFDAGDRAEIIFASKNIEQITDIIDVGGRTEKTDLDATDNFGIEDASGNVRKVSRETAFGFPFLVDSYITYRMYEIKSKDLSTTLTGSSGLPLDSPFFEDLRTGTTSGSVAKKQFRGFMSLSDGEPSRSLSFTKNVFASFTFDSSLITSNSFRKFALGSNSVDAVDEVTTKSIGFLCKGLNVYGFWHDGTAYSEELLTTINNDDVFTLAVAKKSSSIEFYVNGTLQHTTASSITGLTNTSENGVEVAITNGSDSSLNTIRLNRINLIIQQ